MSNSRDKTIREEKTLQVDNNTTTPISNYQEPTLPNNSMNRQDSNSIPDTNPPLERQNAIYDDREFLQLLLSHL